MNNPVYKKLNAARAAFHEHKLTKTGRNEFAKFNYFELSDFLPHALKAFEENGLCGIVSFGIETAEMTITDVETGQTIGITSPMSTAALKGCHAVQNLGAVQTYIRRYLWSAAMELIETDPLDSTTGKEEQQPAKTTKSSPLPSAPKKATAPKAAAADEEIWNVTIGSITHSEGVGKTGKPYERWALEFEDGRKLSVFDKKAAANLEEGQQVRLIVKQDGQYHKFVGIEEAHEELVREPEAWSAEIINVEKHKSGKYYQVFLNDIEHPWVGTKDKDLSVKAAQWIEGGETEIIVKRGKGDIWELVGVPNPVPSLEEEFSEKGGVIE